MGAPKQKWTPEEEAALRAGVDKYGQGKWRAIQKDPEYGPVLTSRSNVDLKDKWRNLSVQAGYPRSVKPRKDAGESLNVFGEVSNFPVPISSTETAPHSYDDIILEALATTQQPNGLSVQSIATFIEQRRSTTTNLRKVLPSKLKSLVVQGRLERVEQNYRLVTGTVRPRPESDDDEMAEMKPATKRVRIDVEAAMLKIRHSEEKAFAAAKALVEAEAFSQAAEAAWRVADRAEKEADAAHITAKVAIHHVRTLERNNMNNISANTTTITNNNNNNNHHVQNFNQSPKLEVPVG